jgi:hypothetical protein
MMVAANLNSYFNRKMISLAQHGLIPPLRRSHLIHEALMTSRASAVSTGAEPASCGFGISR